MSVRAQVAKLVDAADSKSAVRKDVLVRFRSWALFKPCKLSAGADLLGFLLLVISVLFTFFRFSPAILA
jgi:hypothetical protein